MKWLPLTLLLLACASTSFERSDGTKWTIRKDTCCAELEGTSPTVAVDCAGKGCRYERELWCYGTDPGDERRRLEEEEEKACRISCACVCAKDVERCKLMP